jgi:hypothetical protein
VIWTKQFVEAVGRFNQKRSVKTQGDGSCRDQPCDTIAEATSDRSMLVKDKMHDIWRTWIFKLSEVFMNEWIFRALVLE